MTREKFYELMKLSHEFARWMFDIAVYQLFGCEMKLSLINGTAKERYVSLIRNRPEVKMIASYLDVTPEYLSRIGSDL